MNAEYDEQERILESDGTIAEQVEAERLAVRNSNLLYGFVSLADIEIEKLIRGF